ncbi:hypothetical protein HQ590_08545, partial [bacterium]|nr:hypothetical protein [bacterium]
ATARSTDATPLPVRLTNGKRVNLWLVTIPIAPELLTALADLDIIEIEFTKEVHQYRSYPDPISYGFHQGGLPSGVHVYAATLQEAPWTFAWEPDRFGHVWTSPAVAAYTGTISNRTAAALTGKLTVTTRSYDGTEETKQEQAVTVPARGVARPHLSLPVKLNGYHDVVARLQLGDRTWTEQRSFARLAPDTRSVRWTEGQGAMFGWWSYPGGHYTPKADHHVQLMTIAGARQMMHTPNPAYISPETLALMQKHWGRGQSTAYYISPQAWAAEATHDPKDIEAFHQAIDKAFVTWEKDTPEQFKPDVVNFFTESSISPRLTHGNFPEYWQDPPFEYTPEEQKRLRMFMETARIAGEYLRKTHPDRDLMIEWGSPVFAVPLLRAGFPRNLIDGSSPDMPLFERLPEMQLADNVVHQLYELRQEYLKYGMTNPRIQYCEGTFVPTEPGALTWREQMDSYTRWTLLSLGYGVSRFYAGWFAFDCGNYYGAEHYGGCGIQRRIPYCDPKPAYAAFATLTDKLNEANFDGWLPTGSLTTYCQRFKHETRGPIYTLWTVRGTRPVTLTLAQDGKVGITDCMNNTREFTSTNKQVTVTTDQSVIYVTGAELAAVAVGAPDNRDAQPAAGARLVGNLGDGSWRYTADRLEYYENNHWGYYPAAGKFSAAVATDPEHGPVLVSTLEDQGRPRELMPWYNVLKPRRPIVLPGAPSHLGLWVKGASDWGRVIYVVRDANGERWTSIGTKDDYNCNDTHCWSSFNFDGWRYLRFELPGHLGWDSFRRLGTTWWRADDGDDIVDLPLRLEAVIVEQRTHILYVNDVQPVASDRVAFGQLYAEYDTLADTTAVAVRTSRLRMPPPREIPDLPNPIADLARDGVGAPTKLLKLAAPEHWYDGTRMHVHFAEVPGATAYHLWVGAYPDGRGAVDLVPAGIKTGDLVTGLRPGIKLYYWITYVDADGKSSKPSAAHEEVTVDNFKEK